MQKARKGVSSRIFNWPFEKRTYVIYRSYCLVGPFHFVFAFFSRVVFNYGVAIAQKLKPLKK